MIDLRHLRAFREVVDHGSLSAAARALSYTQPAISQQVAALERGVGVPLLDRTSRGVRPTEAGRVLAGHAEAILARAGLAMAEIDAVAGLRGGRVRVASFPTAGAALIPPAVARFLDAHPKIELSAFEAEAEDAIPMLEAGELEIAVVAERQHPGGAFRAALYDGVELDHVLEEPMHALLPRDHRLAGRKRLRLDQLADEVWIELSRGPRDPRGRIHLAASADADFEPRVAFQSDDINVVQEMVAAGAGVAVLPELALRNVTEKVVVRSLGRSAPSRSVAAATLAGTHRSPACEAFLAVLREAGGNRRPPRPSG